MKYTLDQRVPSQTFWNGATALPLAITVLHSLPQMAEFELLSILCTLHGHVTAYDILTGANTGTDKDKDIISVLVAFQAYFYPAMPLSNYTPTDMRNPPITERKGTALDG